MPSTFYSVSINKIDGTGTGGDGFIDNTRIESYIATYLAANPGVDYKTTPPCNLAQAQSRARANVRYEAMVAQMLRMANLYVSNCVATGGSVTTEPSKFSFIIEVERGDEVLYTLDETTPGVALTGTAAIARCIARSMLINRTDTFQYCDPTYTTAPANGGTTDSAMRAGYRVDNAFTVGALAPDLPTATAVITVTALTS